MRVYLFIVMILLLALYGCAAQSNDVSNEARTCDGNILISAGFKTVTYKPIIGARCWDSGGPGSQPWDKKR